MDKSQGKGGSEHQNEHGRSHVKTFIHNRICTEGQGQRKMDSRIEAETGIEGQGQKDKYIGTEGQG